MLVPAIVDNLDSYNNVYDVKHFENGSTIRPINGIAPNPQEFKTIVEDGTVYPIHLDGATKTGLDLIYRDVRKQVKKNAQYKLVLNLLLIKPDLFQLQSLVEVLKRKMLTKVNRLNQI